MATFDSVVFRRSVSPASRSANAAVNGVAVDRMVNGGMQDAVAVVFTGTITDGSHAVSIEDSDDGSTGWATVSAAQLQSPAPTVTSTDDDTVFEVGIRSSRRFVRVTVTTSGATTGGLFNAGIALGAPRFTPVSRP
jgi:hypothetical protein